MPSTNLSSITFAGPGDQSAPPSAPPAGSITARVPIPQKDANGDDIPDAPPPPAAERPAWLPTKFKSAEDMAKAYGELEKKQSAPPKAPAKAGDPPVAPSPVAMAKYSAEYAKDGVLSDASLDELGKAGIGREFVDAYIEGRKAIAERIIGAVHEAAGGAEQFAELTAWASENLPEGERDSYNAAVESGDKSRILLAVRAVRAMRNESEGAPPAVQVRGRPNGGSSVQPFRSQAELTQAMSSRQYANDQAYRDDIAKRLEFTDISNLR